MMLGIYMVLFLTLINTDTVESIYKRWKPNTNFENPANWNVGRVPCGSDVVKFASGSLPSPSVYVQTNSSMKELWLPMNGEMILGDMTTLSFTDAASNNADCPEAQGEVEFTRNAMEWTDPNNWCYCKTALGDCLDIPLLDSEKIPGLYDDVIYPSKSSFFVALGINLKFKIKSLKLFGRAWSTDNLKQFIQSDGGARTFPPPTPGTGNISSISISRISCKTPRAGCLSGNDQGKILEEICLVVKDRCDRARCKSSLIPLASCCSMCGALFNVTLDAGFNITEFEGILQSQFLTGQTGAELIVSRLSLQDNLVQVVVRDKTGDVSVKIAQNIKQDMDTDLDNGGHKYAISAVSMEVSGSGNGHNGPSAHTGDAGGLNSGSVAGIVIGVIIAIVIVVIIYFFMNKNSRRYVQDRISQTQQSLSGRVTVGGGQSLSSRFGRRVEDVGSTEMGTINTSFENRLYTEPLDDLNVQQFNLSLADQQPATFDRNGFDNPLYDTQKASTLYSDPTRKTPDGAEGNTKR